MVRIKHVMRPAALAVALSLGISTGAIADSTQDEIQLLKEQVRILNQKLDQLSKKQESTDQAVTQTQTTAKVAEKEAKEAKDSNFFQKTDKPGLNFKTPGGGFTIYGQLDVSADGVSNGLSSVALGSSGNTPYGNNGGYLPALSTNSTSLGFRGFQSIADLKETEFVWQLQTNLAITAVAGSKETNSQQSNTVNGAMTTGTSYIGLAFKDLGNVKAGKTMAPYYLSTNAMFNPFQGQLGSMDVVMGNTGGDNRVEFGTILEHAVWYESPDMNGWKVNALFAPGQNRATDSSGIPQGSSDCAGGNIPGSGGLTPANAGTTVIGCNDGGFSNAFSASVTYDNKQSWYLAAAYELHKSVNRGSDLADQTMYALDVGDESAAKIGLMYKIQQSGTSIGGIYERMKRDIPASLDFQNERQRNGFWVVLKQSLPYSNEFNLGWAHADRADGDPGQHNTAAGAGAGVDNSANMYTINFVHTFDRNLSVYGNYAATVNSTYAHYDLGAGGHGIKTDCHDAGGSIPASGGESSNPNCWAGANLQGLTVGMRYKF